MTSLVNDACKLIEKCKNEDELNKVKSFVSEVFKKLNQSLWSKK